MTRAMVAAHRGVTAGAAENTIAAFTNAIAVGADMIEFDVRRTRDGELIAFHDTRAGGAPVGALSRDDIATAAGVRPPLLTEVLRACAGRIRLDVELKEDGYVQDVMTVLRAGFDPAQLIVTSFLPAVVAQAKDFFPEVRTGLLVGEGAPWANLSARLCELFPVTTARRVRADYLVPHYRFAPLGVIRRAARAGLPCVLWTVNSPALIRRYAHDPRIAAIITDVTAQAIAIVGARTAQHDQGALPAFKLGPVRLVSLLPSATEIVYALGLGDDLVGVTFECDEPAAARTEKEVVVGGRDTSGMSPAEIDGYVRDQVARGADLYTLHADALARLRPELILTQDLCRVCALPAGQVTEALDYLGCRADVLVLDPYTLDEVLGTILAVGERAGAGDRARQVVDGLRGRLARVAALTAGRPQPRVAVIEWTDPPFAAGHWIPDLVSAAGGEPVAARPGRRSEPVTWPEVAAARPDLVIVAPCGYRLAGAASQAGAAAAELPGVPVWAVDADSLVVRPGPRLVDGVEAIAAILHPDAVPAPPPGRITRVSSGA